MNNYQIKHVKSKGDQAEQLVISGELSFNHILQIKDELNGYKHIKSDMILLIKDIDILDLSFIQLLISLKKHNPHFSIKLESSDEFKELISESGFYQYLINEI